MPLRLPANFQKDIPGLGSTSFSYLSVGLLRKIEEQINQIGPDEKAEVFTRKIVTSLIVTPKLTEDDIKNLPQETYVSLIETSLDILEIKDFFEKTSEELPLEKRFYQAWTEQEKEFNDEMRRVIQSFKPDVIGKLAEFTIPKEYLKSFGEIIRKSHLIEDQFKQSSQVLAQISVVNSRLTESANIFNESVKKYALFNTRVMLPEFQTSLAKLLKEENRYLLSVLRNIPLDLMLSDLKQYQLPEPYLSNALIVSGVNSPKIHTSLYVPELMDLKVTNEEDGEKRRMVDAYDSLYELESSLRKLIVEKLSERVGNKWWKQRIPEAVRNNCEERKLENEQGLDTRRHPFEYAYIGDYWAIIARKDNWTEIFSSIFVNIVELEACFNWIGIARPAIAHIRSLEDEVYTNFLFGSRWIKVRIDRVL